MSSPPPAGDPLREHCGRRPPWSVFRAELEAAGFRPTRGLGQNFLVDSNAARSIAADAGVGRGDRVLEVGAGCGFLTLFLAELGVECLAVEIDARLLAVAARLLAGRENVRFLRADVLAGKHALDPGVLAELPASGPWHLVSNLPYSIAAPLLVVLSRLGNAPRSMTVLVQEEVAQRITARPGEKEWGALTARLGLFYRATTGRAVGAQLFWPRPRVASRVVRLEALPSPAPGPPEVAGFDHLVEALFQRRRKQILGVLAGLVGGRARASALLEGAGLDPRSRPEDLASLEILALSRSDPWRSRAARRP